MKTISHFLPILIGLAVAASPITTDAKVKKDERKKDSAADVQKKHRTQASKKSAQRAVARGKERARPKVSSQKK